MFQIDCPNCGPRGVTEYCYGGEYHSRPENPSEREWADYLYARENRLGIQTEWWYHRAGCRRWFLARRHTLTNEVLETYWAGAGDLSCLSRGCPRGAKSQDWG
jgi:sarcosine oxidase subunit delta